jgi:hypothetical protein
MPTIITRGAASPRGFGFGYSSSLTNYIAYQSFTQPPYSTVHAYGSCTDSSGNFYYVGKGAYTTNSGLYLQKQDSKGNTIWTQGFNDTHLNDICFGYLFNIGTCIDVDSSGNIYVGGSTYIVSTGFTYAFIIKFDSTGSLQYEKKILYSSGTGTDPICVSGLKCDPSSGYIYVGIQLDNSSYGLIKYDSTLTSQWKYRLAGARTFYQDYSYIYGSTNNMALDSSGNIYVNIVTTVTYSGDRAGFIKFDSSGNVLLERRLATGGNSYYGGFGICLDSSNNIYITSGYNNSSYVNGFLSKFDSSGTYLWSYYIATASPSHTIANCLSVDSSNNIYVGGGTGISGAGNAFIMKFNSSGTIQYQRNIGDAGTIVVNRYVTSLIMNGKNAFYITAYGTNTPFIASLPLDGSKTGTYTVGAYSVVYTASSYTISSISLTDSAGTRSTSSGAVMSESTATQTQTTATSTNSVKVI